ncbi:heparinase II/III family protein [Gulosibacter sp. 10]|uniref:heparinase II/III domain-containing protein n=1 Tax=Gulosibacter sp. 10 TaxID=1255570 RepID=UPI000B356CEE|nr:heparinase II/III family protein [Gulosibacter sp. 10]
MNALDYLFRRPSMIAMNRARRSFILQDTISVPGEGKIEIEDGSIWKRRRKRSLARKMHGWLFYYYLRPFHDGDDSAVLEKLIGLLRYWREAVGLPPSRIPMAYHDETTAQRVIALTCLLQDYSELLGPDEKAFIEQILQENSRMLADEEFHSTGTNHGMYQDLALEVVSPHLPDGEELSSLATSRLNSYFADAFTEDGVHKEQSPEYHIIVSSHLRRYVDFLEQRQDPRAGKLHDIWHASERYAIMSISPLGKFAPVSDTTARAVISSGYAAAYDSPEFLYAVSQGALGVAPSDTCYVAESTGVAIYRQDWSDLESTYLYFSAAYNSDYHKHSDELSVYLVHRGIEVLREAGPNGYEMRDPYTEYAFSSFGHNTLIVNGEGLSRVEPDDMGKVALESVPAADAVAFSVEGRNLRYTDVEHVRQITVPQSQAGVAAKTIVIEDVVKGQGGNHYELLWHFGPEVHATLSEGVVQLMDSRGRQLAEISVDSNASFSVDAVRGIEEPMIQGWYFPEMGSRAPADTLIVSFSGSESRLRTEITLH